MIINFTDSEVSNTNLRHLRNGWHKLQKYDIEKSTKSAFPENEMNWELKITSSQK